MLYVPAEHETGAVLGCGHWLPAGQIVQVTVPLDDA